MSAKQIRDLVYGDLIELADLPVFAEVDAHTRHLAEFEYARVQDRSYTHRAGFWLDTSHGYFLVDPALVVDVHGNAPSMFSPRSKR